MHVHHAAITVKDMEKSIAFYRDGLGLNVFQDEVISGPEVDRSLMESGAKVRMVLLMDETGNMIELLDWQSPPARQRPPEHLRFTSTGLVEVAFMVDDLEQVEKSLAGAGYSFRTPVWRFGSDLESYGGAEARIRYVEDPNGVQVELMQVVMKGEP
jgi:catechol 2,3-dioxygenase-like lactoylglutathione lyase family enzyme